MVVTPGLPGLLTMESVSEGMCVVSSTVFLYYGLQIAVMMGDFPIIWAIRRPSNKNTVPPPSKIPSCSVLPMGSDKNHIVKFWSHSLLITNIIMLLSGPVHFLSYLHDKMHHLTIRKITQISKSGVGTSIVSESTLVLIKTTSIRYINWYFWNWTSPVALYQNRKCRNTGDGMCHKDSPIQANFINLSKTFLLEQCPFPEQTNKWFHSYTWPNTDIYH